MNVKIKKLHPDAVIPQYATFGSAGFDLHALEEIVISPGETALVKTGLAFDIPVGYEIQIRPRSGLSLKTKLRVCNAPGTIDQDFRGEVCIIIENTGLMSPFYTINKGDRIAQGVLCPVLQANFIEVDELEETQRNTGAFGSSGV